MAVPYTFGTATASIPLSNLDSNFATTITLGNTAIQLGNTVTTLNNMTLANVAVTSVSTAFPNNLLANSSVTLGNTTVALGGTATTLGNVTLTNATVSSLSTAITVAQGGTGLTSTPANGALDIGNGTGFTRTTLTAGSGISITNGAGSISIAASAGTASSIANGTSNVSIATSGGNVVVATNGNTAVTYDTSQNATFAGYINAPNTFGFKNRIINGQLNINQRGVSGTVTLTAGSYGHDRFKGGASGCTYTFATSNNVTTLTISAGSLIQVIEGLNLESGTYTLSFTGTAQGKIGAGSFSASGVTGSIIGGTNTNIEFNTGTLSLPQLEKGSIATSFDYRSYGTELVLCQRYYENFSNGTGTGSIYEGLTASFATTGVCRGFVPFKVTKRTTPTVTVPTTYTTINWSGGNISPSAGGSNFASLEGASINFTVSTVVAGQACTVGVSSSAPITISAEL